MKCFTLCLASMVAAIAAPSAAAEELHPFSRSPNNVFMVDITSLATNGEVTSVHVVTVPLRTPADDYSHSVETYEIQCATGAWRTAGLVEYGPDGAEAGRYPEEGAAWETLRPNTAPKYLNDIVCEGARATPPVWASVRAFIDAGRP